MTPMMHRILTEVCAANDWEWHTYADGYLTVIRAGQQVCPIYGNKFPHNTAAVSYLCDDKSALSEYLAAHAVACVPHFYCGRLSNPTAVPQSPVDLLRRYQTVVVKDNRGAGGRNVFLVRNTAALTAATHAIRAAGAEVCLSPYCPDAAEYRVVVLHGQVQYAFQKIRPTVTGDGRQTIHDLWRTRPDANHITPDPTLDLTRVPRAGEMVPLIWQHNLCLGARPELVTDRELLAALTAITHQIDAVLPLGFVAVDIIDDRGTLKVLEINSGVSIEHFAAAGQEFYRQAQTTLRRAITTYLR